MIITNAGADYSGAGLGSSDWIVNWAFKAGITDPTQKTALRTFYDAAVANGIWSNLLAVCLFPGSTSATQKLLFENADTPRSITFGGTPVFASTGFNPNGAGYGFLPVTPPVGALTNFSFGVYNSTSETAPSSGSKYLMHAQGENTGGVATYDIRLSRDYDAGSHVTLGTAQVSGEFNFTFPVAGSYDVTKTGFLQFVRNGTDTQLFDNGVSIKQRTVTNIPVGGGIRAMAVGAQNNSAISFSNARQTFAYVGTLTTAQVPIWDGIVRTLLTALGRS